MKGLSFSDLVQIVIEILSSTFSLIYAQKNEMIGIMNS